MSLNFSIDTTPQRFIAPRATLPISIRRRLGSRARGAIALGGLLTFGASAWGAPTTFTYSGASTTWAVPVTGDYTLFAQGAQGGTNYHDEYQGGIGATVLGNFLLTAGEHLTIIVGGVGGGDGESGAGGGGGTFVMAPGAVPLVIAGGGGGAGTNHDGSGTAGGETTYSTGGGGGGGGGGGEGSNSSVPSDYRGAGGGGGGGLLGSGGTGQNSSDGATGGSGGAPAGGAGGAGGQPYPGNYNYVSPGGFGGGGGGDSLIYGGGGGGGGGHTGGTGGGDDSAGGYPGYGGSSYIAASVLPGTWRSVGGDTFANLSQLDPNDNGELIITFDPAAGASDVPEPASLVLLGGALAGLTAARRRARRGGARGAAAHLCNTVL